MRTTPFAAAALVAGAVATNALLFAGQASAASCSTDGVAQLCATTTPGGDSVNIDWGVTQLDGPGSYSIHYVDQNTGLPSNPVPVGPLAYQKAASGQLFGALTHCFVVVLTSPAGTTLTSGPVC